MLIGNHWADNEAKRGMQYHCIDWREHQEADDGRFIACIAQHLINSVWEELFALDMRLMHGFDTEEGEQPNQEGEDSKDWEDAQEMPPAMEDPQDPWEAEEEVARWTHEDQEEGGNKERTGALRGGFPLAGPLAGDNPKDLHCPRNTQSPERQPRTQGESEQEDDQHEKNAKLYETLASQIPNYDLAKARKRH